jgi:hypothetical protein
VEPDLKKYLLPHENLKKVLGDTNAVAHESALACVLAWLASAPESLTVRYVQRKFTKCLTMDFFWGKSPKVSMKKKYIMHSTRAFFYFRVTDALFVFFLE